MRGCIINEQWISASTVHSNSSVLFVIKTLFSYSLSIFSLASDSLCSLFIPPSLCLLFLNLFPNSSPLFLFYVLFFFSSLSVDFFCLSFPAGSGAMQMCIHFSIPSFFFLKQTNKKRQMQSPY